MKDSAVADGNAPEGAVKFYKRDFWIDENRKHIPAHYRLKKSARIINSLAGRKECDLLDVGCGPATLMGLLPENIHYYGIDLAIHAPAPNLIESDIAENPIRFGDKTFDIIVALGLFEYVGDRQSRKFSEIAELLNEHGIFIVTYTNFDHRHRQVFDAFNNVQPFEDFRRDLSRYFVVDRCFPASHNWSGGQPTRKLVKFANAYVSRNVPVVSPRLAVEYFLICSPLGSRPHAGL